MLHLNNLQYVDGIARLYSYVPTSVDDPNVSGSSNMLLTNSPNPFNVSTTISYYGTANSHELLQIKIYNVKGQLVKKLGLNLPLTDWILDLVRYGTEKTKMKKVSPALFL